MQHLNMFLFKKAVSGAIIRESFYIAICSLLFMSLKQLVQSGFKVLGKRKSQELARQEAPDKVRVIIEGGFQDEWRDLHVDADAYVIPQGTMKVDVGYVLDLVARVNEGRLELVDE